MVKEVNGWSNVYNSVKGKELKQRAKAKLTTLWVDIYNKAPSEKIKKKAIEALNDLGIDPRSVLDLKTN